MKPSDHSMRGKATARRVVRLAPIPMEWMDPMGWRLPSGKALAEFALQTGFLAPLMLSTPKPQRKQPAAAQAETVQEHDVEGIHKTR